jgi:hypothetical protein
VNYEYKITKEKKEEWKLTLRLFNFVPFQL